MTIWQQSGTALLQWQSFGIGPHASVHVHSAQPDSLLINRVVGNAPSVIEGVLHSDGSVWLINPNGINCIEGNRIDTRAFLTSQHDIEPALLMDAASALLIQPAPLTDVRRAAGADTVNTRQASTPITPITPITPAPAREAALARIAIAPPAIPRYLLSPVPEAPTELASPTAWRREPSLGSQRTVAAEPLSGRQIYTWFASPSMATPVPGVDPFSSDESDY
jgi:filamentous hemagglutinin family protein